MKQVKTKDEETLEEAYNNLIEAARYQQVYMIYKGVRIDPILSLDEAYKTVYGCSKSEYELRQNQAKMIPSEKETEKGSVFDDKPSDVIRDIRTSIMLKNIDEETGLYRSIVARSYIIKMSGYAQYCKEDTRDEWKKSIVYYVYAVGRKKPDGKLEFPDNVIEDILNFYEILGKIMKAINDGMSWNDVKRLVDSYSLSKEDIENLISCMLHYSSSGDDFVINVFNKDPMIYKLDQ